MHTKYNTDDLRICGTKEVIAPVQVHTEMPISEAAAQTTALARQDIHKILAGLDDLVIVMRVYFEKPRTTVGWKGLINDPI